MTIAKHKTKSVSVFIQFYKPKFCINLFLCSTVSRFCIKDKPILYNEREEKCCRLLRENQ